MTPEEKKRFTALVGLLDSDQSGERETALGKIHAVYGKVFAELVRQAHSAISQEDLEKIEQNLAQWKKAHDAKEQENAQLKTQIVALITSNKSLRSALWFALNFRRLALAATVLAFASGGGWLWWGAQAAPDQQPASSDPAQTSADAALRDVLSRTRWKSDDSPPVIVTINGRPWWAIARGSADANSHSDAWGQPLERHCVRIYAVEAIADAGAFVSPSPYFLGFWLRWPLRAAECRMPGAGGYS